MNAAHALLIVGALILVGGAAANASEAKAMMGMAHREGMMGMDMEKMMDDMATSMDEMMDRMGRMMASHEAGQEEQCPCPCPSEA